MPFILYNDPDYYYRGARQNAEDTEISEAQMLAWEQAQEQSTASATAAAAALAARKDVDAIEAAETKADAQVQTFLNFTPVELDAWVNANITGAGNKTVFKVLGRLAQVAARGRALR